MIDKLSRQYGIQAEELNLQQTIQSERDLVFRFSVSAPDRTVQSRNMRVSGRYRLGCQPPNRIIYHHDVNYIAMRLNEDFAHLITDAKVYLISGFNAMQNEDELQARLGHKLDLLDAV